MKNPKNPKSERAIQKALKKQCNIQKDKLGGDSAMYCTAIFGKKVVSALSGPVETGTYYDKLFKEFEDMLPWKDKTRQKGKREFTTCAEAKLWVDIVSRRLNPKDFTIMAHNKHAKDAPPCENCKCWVGDAFGKVEKFQSPYRTKSSQNPTDSKGKVDPNSMVVQSLNRKGTDLTIKTIPIKTPDSPKSETSPKSANSPRFFQPPPTAAVVPQPSNDVSAESSPIVKLA